MATLQQKIAEKFFSTLAESKDVDASKVEQLRKLFAEGKKLKADDFVRILSGATGGDVK